jgi:hypothetical protein
MMLLEDAVGEVDDSPAPSSPDPATHLLVEGLKPPSKRFAWIMSADAKVKGLI